jgi:hypothetical protein
MTRCHYLCATSGIKAAFALTITLPVISNLDQEFGGLRTPSRWLFAADYLQIFWRNER